MKKSALLLGLVLSMGAVASAAPAENYEAGKVSIDLGTTISPKLEVSPGTSFDASNDFSGGLTVGLGHNFALQYGYDKTGAKEVNTYYEDVGYTEKDNGKVTANTVNLLYKINPKVSAYLGNRHVSGELNCQWGGMIWMEAFMRIKRRMLRHPRIMCRQGRSVRQNWQRI